MAATICAVASPFIGVVGGAAAGAAFYVGREVRDREKLGAWDWPGLITPISINTLIAVIWTLIA